MTKFFVGLINVSLREDVERGANKSKEGCIEVYRAVSIQRHVHRHKTLEVQGVTMEVLVEYLAGHAMRTQFSKAQWGRDFPGQNIQDLKMIEGHKPKKSDNVNMLDEPLGIGIVFAPQMNKLGKMVGTKDGPVPREVVKVVHDDRNEEVENEEGAHNEEADEVRVGNVRPTSSLLSCIIRCLVAWSIFPE